MKKYNVFYGFQVEGVFLGVYEAENAHQAKLKAWNDSLQKDPRLTGERDGHAYNMGLDPLDYYRAVLL